LIADLDSIDTNFRYRCKGAKSGTRSQISQPNRWFMPKADTYSLTVDCSSMRQILIILDKRLCLIRLSKRSYLCGSYANDSISQTMKRKRIDINETLQTK
jgi:hypothetical protein